MHYPVSIIVRCKACGKEHEVNLVVDKFYNYLVASEDDQRTVSRFDVAVHISGYTLVDDPLEQKHCLICPDCQEEINKIEQEEEENKRRFVATRVRSLFENGK